MNSQNIPNLQNIQNIQNIHSISNAQKQSFIAAVTDTNTLDMATSTNILLSNNNIFTSPLGAFTNRNNIISTPSPSLFENAVPNLTIPPSALDNESIFKLPEPYVSKDVLFDSNVQKSHVDNNIKEKKNVLNTDIPAIPSTSIMNQIQTNLENEQFTFNNITINEENNTLEEEEPFLMPSLISPSLNPNSLYQNIHSGNKEKHNLLTSPVIIPEYNRKSSYPLSKTTQRHKYNKSNSIPKSSTSIPNSLNTNIVSPIFITNQNNNISSISHNYHLPGSIMPLTIGSPTKSNTNEPIYKDNDNNNLNRYHSQHNNNNIVLADHVHFGDEKSSLNEAQLYSFSSEKSKVLSISDTKNYKSIPLAYNIHGKSDDSGNTNKIDYKKDAFSPLVGPMITNPTNFMSSPSIKPIPQSMLPITPSVLMHLDNQLTSSITANNQQTTETTKQKNFI